MPELSPATRSAARRDEVLTMRALNRALIERQFLRERVSLGAVEAIEHLAGMQSQQPLAPYVGLWTRLEGFAVDELAKATTDRQVVRAPMMRGTIHVVSARDALAFRPVVQRVLERATYSGSPFGRALIGLDEDAFLAMARRELEAQPRTRTALGALLAKRWPARDASSLAYCATYLLPVVQVPPRGVWGGHAQATWTTVEGWLGRGMTKRPSVGALMMRYFAAFGPATIDDAQAWSGLTHLREAVDRLRPRLRTFRGEDGSELFDLPDAPRPDPETPVPPRFLPEYDNLLLSHADRSRVIVEQRAPSPLPGKGAGGGSLLVDGVFAGFWRIVREAETATLLVVPFAPLGADDRDGLEAEAEHLIAFVAPDAERRNVAFAAPQ